MSAEVAEAGRRLCPSAGAVPRGRRAELRRRLGRGRASIDRHDVDRLCLASPSRPARQSDRPTGRPTGRRIFAAVRPCDRPRLYTDTLGRQMSCFDRRYESRASWPDADTSEWSSVGRLGRSSIQYARVTDAWLSVHGRRRRSTGGLQCSV